MQDLIDTVLRRLDQPSSLDTSLRALNSLYAAWCRQVPFDNLRKIVALYDGDSAELPGTHAEDFFHAWLEHGTGGTCWSSSNALFTLLKACGFDARQIVCHMLDMGIANHASNVVTIDGEEWLADSSMLSNQVLPLRAYLHQQPPPSIEIEPIDGTFRVWVEFLGRPLPIPCRISNREVGYEIYRHSYEASRQKGPFNDRIYARRNVPGGMITVVGCRRYLKTNGPVQVSGPLSSVELRHCLVTEMGYSPALIEQLERCGAWNRSLEPEAEAPSPPPGATLDLPPSMR